MKRPPILTATFAALVFFGTGALAQEAMPTSTDVRNAVEQAAPNGWRLENFTILETGAVAAPEPEPANGKAPPAPPVGLSEGAKPAPQAPAAEATRFSATLVAVARIYEPLYALDGHAIVRELFDAGLEIPVTGSYSDKVVFDQSGIEDLGRPLDGFDLPALVEGSAEADTFFAGRDEARAEGTMNKIMADEGEEL